MRFSRERRFVRIYDLEIEAFERVSFFVRSFFFAEDSMRFSTWIVSMVSVGAAAGIAVVGCSSSSGGNGASTGDGGAKDGGTGNGDGGGNSDGGGSEDGGISAADTGSNAPCAPKASCTAPDKNCIGLVSNQGQTKFGLRMSELDFASPASLTMGIVDNVFGGAVGLDLPSCNLSGTGTFSWLLQFDTQAMTLETGGAKPVADPTQGYSFDDEMVQGLHIQAITFPNITPDSMGNFSVTTGVDIIMPIFLNAAGTSVVLLPIHQMRLLMGKLSSNNDCIGTYNAAGLDPTNSCNPDSTHPQFIDNAALDGYITLEEADGVIISAINQSLCVLLSGNSTMYGVTSAEAGGATVCKRDSNGNIVYQGGWCSTTNMAATSTCADADELKANFAASSVKIN